jgi:predicted aspartyl protease
MPVRLAALAAALLVAACAGGETEHASCGLRPRAELPIELRRNIPVVPASVNGVPAAMILDTGAEHTVLLASFVDRIRLKRDFRHATMIRGIGTPMASAVAQPEQIGLGKAVIGRPPVIVGSFSTGDLPGGLPAGLLGADILAGFDLDVDIPGRRLTLYPPCPGIAPPWPEPSVALPGRLARGRFFIPLVLDGVTVPVAVDTGAEYSLISTRAAQAAGVSPPMLAQDPPAYLTVVGPDQVTARVHRFHEIRLGLESYANPALPVLPLTGNPIDGILGMNYLRHHRLWLAYKSGRVFVGPPSR